MGRLNFEDCKGVKDSSLETEFQKGSSNFSLFFFFSLHSEEEHKDYDYVYWKMCKLGCGKVRVVVSCGSV